jgi:hypothetical protein
MMETSIVAKTNNYEYSNNHIKGLNKASSTKLFYNRNLQKLMFTRTQNLTYAIIP